MSINNTDLVRKAVISATNSLAASGKLNDAQADKFLDYVFDETVLSKVARTVKFRNENLDIDKIGIGARAAMSKSEGVDPGYRRGISTSQVTLTPREIIVPFEITDVFFEVNIEGGKIEDHIVQMFAKQLANDLEELYLHGSNSPAPIAFESEVYPGGSASLVISDSYLGLFDGLVNLADGGNTVDAGGDPLSMAVFRQMLNALPSKFRRDKSKLRFFCSLEMETLWREKLASRGTAAGDQALAGGIVAPFGIPLVPIPLMEHYVPVTEDITFTGANSTVNLTYGPIQAGSVRVAASTLASTPSAPFALTTDFTVDSTAGTITQVNTGTIGTTETVRVTYRAYPQMVLTHESNMVIGLGRDIRMEKDRDIFRGVNQYALTVKAAVEFEEDTAVVKAYNIDDSL